MTIADEDQYRAEAYILFAMLLAGPPQADLLEMIAGLVGDDSSFGRSVSLLSKAAAHAHPATLNEEYHKLFVGISNGEIIPYASYYIDGSLYSKPLARLRIDMARLGIARAQKANEPEDHVSALCEMMAGLILGTFGKEAAGLETQKEFFEKHLFVWMPRFFADLEAAPSASFYMTVGLLGREFMAIESQAFGMIE